jgi:hypothetical protein
MRLPRPRRFGSRAFWTMRLGTLFWGFGVSLLFTGSLLTSAAMWTVVVIGNTVIMWWATKS